ncbi:MAG: hypothetical protein H0U71_08365 [Gammaproteobacteria bacterium]|nr:hypothetical protein [Gammaproteobacteria bacterium]
MPNRIPNRMKIANLKRNYQHIYSKLHTVVEKELRNASTVSELAKMELRATMELEKLYAIETELQETLSVLEATRPNTFFDDLFIKSLKDLAKFIDEKPAAELLFPKITARKEELDRKLTQTLQQLEKRGDDLIVERSIKAEQYTINVRQEFKKIAAKFGTSGFDIARFDNFLINPKVKAEIEKNASFALKVKELSKKIIVLNAKTIASMDAEKFLKVTREELLTPWNYPNQPGLAEYTGHINKVSQFVTEDILDTKNPPLDTQCEYVREQSAEKRALILERWIWTSFYLFHELKDYTGFNAINSALSTHMIFNLTKTWAAISDEANDANTSLGAILVPPMSSGKKSHELTPHSLDTNKPCIPHLGHIQRAFVFTLENPNVSKIRNKETVLKRDEIANRTSTGHLVDAFDFFQHRIKTEFWVDSIDVGLKKSIENLPLTHEDVLSELRFKLEPVGNNLIPAQPVNLGCLYTPSKSFGQPSPANRQQIALIYIEKTKKFLAAHAPLLNKNQIIFSTKEAGRLLYALNTYTQRDESKSNAYNQEKERIATLVKPYISKDDEITCLLRGLEEFSKNDLKTANLVKPFITQLESLRSQVVQQAWSQARPVVDSVANSRYGFLAPNKANNKISEEPIEADNTLSIS